VCRSPSAACLVSLVGESRSVWSVGLYPSSAFRVFYPAWVALCATVFLVECLSLLRGLIIQQPERTQRIPYICCRNKLCTVPLLPLFWVLRAIKRQAAAVRKRLIRSVVAASSGLALVTAVNKSMFSGPLGAYHSRRAGISLTQRAEISQRGPKRVAAISTAISSGLRAWAIIRCHLIRLDGTSRHSSRFSPATSFFPRRFYSVHKTAASSDVFVFVFPSRHLEESRLSCKMLFVLALASLTAASAIPRALVERSNLTTSANELEVPSARAWADGSDSRAPCGGMGAFLPSIPATTDLLPSLSLSPRKPRGLPYLWWTDLSPQPPRWHGCSSPCFVQRECVVLI